MREPTNHRIAGPALAAAAAAPRVVGDDPTGQHRTVGFEPLTGHDETKVVETAERGQIRTGEARPRGSVRHVEVFLDGERENFHPRGDLDLYPGNDPPGATPSSAMSRVCLLR